MGYVNQEFQAELIQLNFAIVERNSTVKYEDEGYLEFPLSTSEDSFFQD